MMARGDDGGRVMTHVTSQAARRRAVNNTQLSINNAHLQPAARQPADVITTQIALFAF